MIIPPPETPLPQIDSYELIDKIGAGGYGTVYRARHLFLEREVAIKLLNSEIVGNRDGVRRFFREAQAADAVGSIHVAEILDCGMLPNGQPFISMELLRGEPLRYLLQREAPLPIDQALSIGVQFLEGLGAVHRAGIVHRDLKPENIFLCDQAPENDERAILVKIVDFGTSKFRGSFGDALTQQGMWLGTAVYSAPEQFSDARSVDHRADLYSAAAVIFEMLSGQRIVDNAPLNALALLAQKGQRKQLCEVAPWLPLAIVDVVERGLATDPSMRWSNAEEFTRALQSASVQPREPAPLKAVSEQSESTDVAEKGRPVILLKNRYLLIVLAIITIFCTTLVIGILVAWLSESFGFHAREGSRHIAVDCDSCNADCVRRYCPRPDSSCEKGFGRCQRSCAFDAAGRPDPYREAKIVPDSLAASHTPGVVSVSTCLEHCSLLCSQCMEGASSSGMEELLECGLFSGRCYRSCYIATEDIVMATEGTYRGCNSGCRQWSSRCAAPTDVCAPIIAGCQQACSSRSR